MSKHRRYKNVATLLVLLCAAVCTTVVAQAVPACSPGVGGAGPTSAATHDFYLYTEYSRTLMLDHLASPNVIAGNGVVLDAGYRRETGRGSLGIRAEAMWADLERYGRGETLLAQTGFTQVGIPVAGLRERFRQMVASGLEVEILFVVLEPGRDSVGHSTGLGASVGFTIEEQARFPLAANQHGLMNLLSIDLTARAEYQLGERSVVEGRLSFPAGGLVTRLPWSTDPEFPNQTVFASFFRNGTRFATVNTLQHIQTAFSWTYSLSPVISLSAGYGFEWLHYSLPRHITIAGSTFYLGVLL